MGGELAKFDNAQIEDIFAFMDAKSDNMLRLEQFVTVFSTEKRKKVGKDGKDDVGRAKVHSFTEVLMECTDERGGQKDIVVPVNIKWDDLLQKLKNTFKRSVTLMYEDSGQHQHTIKDAKDLTRCWDSLAASGKGQEGTRHLECMIVDFDPAVKTKGSKTTGRPSLKERRRNAARVHGAEPTDLERDPVESLDFRSRHKWIDDMMKLLGAPLENEPGAMHNKWDKLLNECAAMDITLSGIVTVDAFRNALQRTEDRMTAEHVEWFVQDADKDSKGDVLYEQYAKTKQRGQSSGNKIAGSGLTMQREVEQATDKIKNALKVNFKSLQQAFKRMDVDRDGRLSRDEFRKGVEQRLKLRLPAKLLDEVIHMADKGGDGFIDYEDFLGRFNVAERKVKLMYMQVSLRRVYIDFLGRFNVNVAERKVDILGSQRCRGLIWEYQKIRGH